MSKQSARAIHGPQAKLPSGYAAMSSCAFLLAHRANTHRMPKNMTPNTQASITATMHLLHPRQKAVTANNFMSPPPALSLPSTQSMIRVNSRNAAPTTTAWISKKKSSWSAWSSGTLLTRERTMTCAACISMIAKMLTLGMVLSRRSLMLRYTSGMSRQATSSIRPSKEIPILTRVPHPHVRAQPRSHLDLPL